MPTIYDLVTAANVASYVIESASNQVPFLGATLFPSKKKAGLELSWIKGANGLPVALTPSVFDAKAPVRDRMGVSEVKTEMPFFREAMRIGEQDRQNLMNLLATNNSALYETHVNRIYDDVGQLVKGADVQPERMIMQLLSTGKIAINANGVPLDYNYGLKDERKEVLTGTAKWSDAASTPLVDIQRWQDTVEDATGTRPTNGIMTRKTFGYLLKHEGIRKAITPLGGEFMVLTDAKLKDFLQNTLGLSVAVYNKKFIDEAKVAKGFFPDDVFTLLPSGTLGNTYYGTTPEEADLLTGSTAADVKIVNTGVAVTTVKEPHPVNVQTIVSEIVMPSFESIDNIFIATVG